MVIDNITYLSKWSLRLLEVKNYNFWYQQISKYEIWYHMLVFLWEKRISSDSFKDLT